MPHPVFRLLLGHFRRHGARRAARRRPAARRPEARARQPGARGYDVSADARAARRRVGDQVQRCTSTRTHGTHARSRHEHHARGTTHHHAPQHQPSHGHPLSIAACRRSSALIDQSALVAGRPRPGEGAVPAARRSRGGDPPDAGRARSTSTKSAPSTRSSTSSASCSRSSGSARTASSARR